MDCDSSVNFNVLKKGALLIVISGPSGVGKDSVVKALKSRSERFHFVVTANTRAPRPDEVEGVDYFFVSKDHFEEMIKKDELAEWAHVYGDYKGVPKIQVEDALASGKDVLMRLDIQGAKRIKKIYPFAILIFLVPSNEEEWNRRLLARAKEQGRDVDMDIRIEKVKEELNALDIFDYAVVNADYQLDQTVETILAIITAEHHKLCKWINKEIQAAR
ncbi:MAG: guanylate kinase [Anaerolineaceae bacterium]|jgi:guanylate kinase|nr:MAG: guanylate kinase [Anaerolineaceae bacterium]